MDGHLLRLRFCWPVTPPTPVALSYPFSYQLGKRLIRWIKGFRAWTYCWISLLSSFSLTGPQFTKPGSLIPFLPSTLYSQPKKHTHLCIMRLPGNLHFSFKQWNYFETTECDLSVQIDSVMYKWSDWTENGSKDKKQMMAGENKNNFWDQRWLKEG